MLEWLRRFGRKDGGARDGRPMAPGEARDGDFDAFLCEWASGTGAKVTAARILSVLRGAEDGSPSDQAALFQTIQEKEPVVNAHLQTRKLAALARNWKVVSSDPAKAAELTMALKRAGIYSLCRHLLDAIATGYSGSAILWGADGGTVRGFKHIHPTNWAFDAVGNPALMTSDCKERPLADYHPQQFIFHCHALKPGVPARGGLLRTLVWLYFFKHYAMRDRARYLERFGIPFMIAKISDRDFEDKATREAIKRSLVNIGSDGVGITTANSALDIIEPSRSGGDEFQRWFGYIDEVYALAILGQVASSKAASGLSQGQMQADVRQDILEADCRSLMETVNQQLVRPLELFKYGAEGDAEFQIDCDPPDDMWQKARIVQTLTAAGFKISPAYVRETFNVPVEG